MRVDVQLAEETIEKAIAVIEASWISWAGPPTVLRLDMSGLHMSGTSKERASQ